MKPGPLQKKMLLIPVQFKDLSQNSTESKQWILVLIHSIRLQRLSAQSLCGTDLSYESWKVRTPAYASPLRLILRVLESSLGMSLGNWIFPLWFPVQCHCAHFAVTAMWIFFILSVLPNPSFPPKNPKTLIWDPGKTIVWVLWFV